MQNIKMTLDNIFLRGDQFCNKCAIKLNKVNIHLLTYSAETLQELDLWSSAKLIQVNQQIQYLCSECHQKAVAANKEKHDLIKEVALLKQQKVDLEKELEIAKNQLKEQEVLFAFAKKMNLNQVVEHQTVFKNFAERIEEVCQEQTPMPSELQEMIMKLKSPFDNAQSLYNESSMDVFIKHLDEFDKFIAADIETCEQKFKKLEDVESKIREAFQGDIESGLLNEHLIKKIIGEHGVEAGIQDKKELQQRSKLIRDQIEKSFI